MGAEKIKFKFPEIEKTHLKLKVLKLPDKFLMDSALIHHQKIKEVYFLDN